MLCLTGQGKMEMKIIMFTVGEEQTSILIHYLVWIKQLVIKLSLGYAVALFLFHSHRVCWGLQRRWTPASLQQLPHCPTHPRLAKPCFSAHLGLSALGSLWVLFSLLFCQFGLPGMLSWFQLSEKTVHLCKAQMTLGSGRLLLAVLWLQALVGQHLRVEGSHIWLRYHIWICHHTTCRGHTTPHAQEQPTGNLSRWVLMNTALACSSSESKCRYWDSSMSSWFPHPHVHNGSIFLLYSPRNRSSYVTLLSLALYISVIEFSDVSLHAQLSDMENATYVAVRVLEGGTTDRSCQQTEKRGLVRRISSCNYGN